MRKGRNRLHIKYACEKHHRSKDQKYWSFYQWLSNNIPSTDMIQWFHCRFLLKRSNHYYRLILTKPWETQEAPYLQETWWIRRWNIYRLLKHYPYLHLRSLSQCVFFEHCCPIFYQPEIYADKRITRIVIIKQCFPHCCPIKLGSNRFCV